MSDELKSEFAPFSESEKRILNLDTLNAARVEPLVFPWPKCGEVYDCILAIHPNKGGILVDGPELIRAYCSEFSYNLEDLDIDTNAYEPGIYRAKLKYWGQWSNCAPWDSEYEDGFEVVEITKVTL